MIRAIFTEDINTVSVPGLIQWDYGQKLLILGLTLPDVAEVHFASDTLYSEAITRFTKKDADSGGYLVDIPNEVLREPHDIKAWVYLIDKTQGKTLKTILLPLFKRSRPKDFVNPPDPAEETLLNETISEINRNTEQMRQDQEQFKSDMSKRQITFENKMSNDFDTFKNEVSELFGLDDNVTATDKTWSSSKINTELGKKANTSDVKSTVKTITIQPTAWVGGIYTLSDSLITATSNQEFLPPIYTAEKAEMIEAIQAANIQDGGQSAGQAKIVCTGEVPTIAIELRVIFRGVK